MARTSTETAWPSEPLSRVIPAGIVGGLIAGLAMGLVFQFLGLMSLLGGLTGSPSLLRGWLLHLAVSALYGLSFALIVSYQPLREQFPTFGGHVALGLVYGAGIVAVTFGFLIPFGVELLGLEESEFVQRLVPGPTVGEMLPALLLGIAHLIYGLVLGVVVALGLGYDYPD